PAQRGRGVEANWVDLEPFLAQLVHEQVPAAKAKGIVLQADLAACDGWEVQADRVRLGRLLSNLLVNAIRYTPVGRVVLTAEWRDAPQGNTLALGVVDTGTGIASEEQDSIFQPFERGRAGKEDDSG